ncbi:MAG: hypothetical protein HKO58_04605, partial [Gammaproteobacteria bacterium]|nr:hypothetical protein [Gammaproteobacteria bacterium]
HLVLLAALVTSLTAWSSTETNKRPLSYNPVTVPNITVKADFTDPQNQIGEIFDFFDVSVRTERANPLGTPAHFGRKKLVNTVRMLGGWRNQDLNGDTYQWNGEKYIYNFETATKRIDGWLNNNWGIFQIVLDNPPWAFQRGYDFVEQPDGKSYLGKDRVGVYGNGLPPNDAKAWNRYMQAFINHLVEKYGKEQVLSWRFRVGSEIDTRPQHWSGTRQQFFDHYKNTVEAVHAVLPDAVIGAHFREGSFKSNYVDYTGNKENSYAVPFVVWAKQNKVHYDFLAVSYYPHITKQHELDLEHVYDHDMAPIHQHPDFNPNASFEIHEFRFISKMLKAGFVSVATSHASSFFAMMSKMMLEKDIREVFQWGNQQGGNYSPDAMTQLALNSMVGNQHFKSQTAGTSLVKHNEVDGIFSQNAEQSRYDVLLYNFNKNNFDYQQPEPARIAFNVNQEPGSVFQYRIGKINRFNNVEDQFFAEFPQAYKLEKDGGWRKPELHKTASADKLLNKTGQAVYKKNRNKYGKTNKLAWSDWLSAQVVDDGKGNAVVWIDTQIESFGVQKLEVQF